MPSVITITPAPSIDRTYYVDSLQPGTVRRANKVTEELAGKGVNVGHALTLGKIEARAVVPIPRADHERWEARPWVRPVAALAPTRISVTVLEPDGRTTKINQAPPELERSVWDNLLRHTEREGVAKGCQFLALCGAIPRLTDGGEVPLGEARDLASQLGAELVMDTSGPELRHWATQGIPDLIKPNADELAECVGRTLVTFGDVFDAAEEVQSWGVETILVSLGIDGMMGVGAGRVTVAVASEPVAVVSTIGAGDASLAGYLAHRVRQPTDFAGAVSSAVAWGSAKVSQEGSQLASVEGLPVVSVSASVDRQQPLREPAVVSTDG
jgi:1-phosphofructokinase